MKKKIFFLLSLLFIFLLSAKTYKEPNDFIKQIFDISANRYLSYSSFMDFAIEYDYSSYTTLEQLAQPTIKLAGKEILPNINASPLKYEYRLKRRLDINSLEFSDFHFPEDIVIRFTKFSNNKQKLAVIYEKKDALHILIYNLADDSINYYDTKINGIFGSSSLNWFNDNRTILVTALARNQDLPESTVPQSPIIEETSGKKSQVRTYQNLLQNPEDERLFDYYFTSQLTMIDTKKGKTKKIFTPQIFYDIDISPNSKYIFLSTIEKPYSYQVPYYRFPKKHFVIDRKGKLIKQISSEDVQDEIPIGGVKNVPRYFSWQPHKSATLYWAEALDDGNPKKDVEYRDKIMSWEAPFDSAPTELFKTEHRYRGIDWSMQEDELIYYEFDRDRMWFYTYLYDIQSEEKIMLYDRNANDSYKNLGSLVQNRNENNQNLFTKINNKIFYIDNSGASPQGRIPKVISFDLNSHKVDTLFTSKDGFFETILGFANQDLSKILIKRQSKSQWKNYFSYDLKTKEYSSLTNYQNPYPEAAMLEPKIINYNRKDGVPLSGKLYLPKNYDKTKRLPLVLHAYPEEYTDVSTAGQLTQTDNTFPTYYGQTLKYFALSGYAVLTNASFPIIGDPQTVNDSFLEQLEQNAQAAISYLDSLQIIDPNKVGCVGHSYGAFMVANILAHTDLCQVGIAKSGAYNRTLTPFGFQSERRIFWKAKDFYYQVSPFMHADKLDEPLLLIHGEDDPNSGTYPMQSKRLFQAIKGNGGTSRLVILPLEGHSYRARKSNLHVIAEMIEWFDRYLK